MDCSGAILVVVYREDSADMPFLCYHGRALMNGTCGGIYEFDPCKNQDVLIVFYLCTHASFSLVLEECD